MNSYNFSSTPPCKGCVDRYLGCHDSCSKYSNWKKESKVETKAKNRFIKGSYELNETKLAKDKHKIDMMKLKTENSEKAKVPIHKRPKLKILGLTLINYGTDDLPLFSKKDVSMELGSNRIIIGYNPSMLVKKQIANGFDDDILITVDGLMHTILNVSTEKSKDLRSKLINRVMMSV